jgi:hypothetical protein
VVIDARCFLKNFSKHTRYQKGKKMNLKKASIITLTASSLLVVPFVLAQQGSSTPDTSVQDVRGGPRGGAHGHGGFGEGRGMGVPLRGLGLGSTATITFYDGDPAAGGATLNSLTFTSGEDSEAAFAEQFEEAKTNAAYMQVDLSEQTRTVDLSTVADDQRGDSSRALGMLGRLSEGSTLTAAFYATDPATAGATATQTLTFTQGSSSAAGFEGEFATATATAQFVTITTSPQSYTVNLADMQNGPDFQGRGPRGDFGPGQDGPNQDGINQVEPSQTQPSEVAPGESS